MKRNILLFLLAIMACVGVNAGKHYTVIISLDGCRWDYPLYYDMPFLDRLGNEGVKAVMQPSFPSKTFPNHYTLATGLVPDHHGLIANNFYDVASDRVYSISDPVTKNDPSFYGGEPIWITAKNQGKKTGVVYWPGSDVAIKGTYPDYYNDYNKRPLLTYPARIAEIERLLKLPEDERPDLVMAYFDEPDHSGHSFGPEAKETRKSAETMDCLLEQLYNDLRKLPYGNDINFIVTSDHGMARTSNERIIKLSEYLKPEWCKLIRHDLPTLVFPNKGCEEKIIKALKDVPHIRVWRKNEVPEYLKYGTNANVAEIVILPDVGWIITESNEVIAGNHGFDPTVSDMHVPFRACGPDFKNGYVKGDTFVNTAVYPLLSRLIGITPASCDGSVEDVKDLLK
ncbi:MAG: ectonucleotide pyrophosphatase/phosphodiesterase [Prevotellaceae bacterium]|nr:ectonucleotide pyrophosphatase/phosphodiesterase [Prevotellaceae bacterium]